MIELILVLALLAMMAAIVMPRFAGFTMGRKYNAEWNRFVACLRYARNEAIARSVPVEVRFDTQGDSYRLVGGYGFDHLPDGTSTHTLPKGLEFEFTQDPSPTTGPQPPPSTEVTQPSASGQTRGSGTQTPDQPTIVFWPDGTVDPTSPDEITLKEKSGEFHRTVQRDAVFGYAVPVKGFNDSASKQRLANATLGLHSN